jgi:hypothetical protein
MGNRSLATFAGPAAQCGLARLRHILRPPSWFDDQVWYAVSRFSLSAVATVLESAILATIKLVSRSLLNPLALR